MNTGKPYDAVIIGGGHNGLVCAAYLARTGLRTLVLERREVVGGACVTEPLFPGCRVSTAACWYGMLRPRIITDLNLYEHGLDPYPMDPQVLALFPDSRHLFFWLDSKKTALEVARFVGKDAFKDVPGLYRFNQYVDKVLEVIDPLFLRPPLEMSAIARSFADQGNAQMYDDVFGSSVADILDKFLHNDQLKAAIAFSAIAIANTSPFAPGTAYDLFYMMAAETRGEKKAWGFARGGMGSITTALAAAARSSGAEIWTNSPVEEIIVQDGRACGVVLSNGLEIQSRVVVSNADPKCTFLRLVPPGSLDNEFTEQISRIRMLGSSSVIHLLLDGLPKIRGAASSGVGDEHRGMLVIAPSLEYLDRAWADAREGRISTYPVLTMSMQSVTDDSIAPPGKHILSIFVQFTPYELKGMSWKEGKEQLLQRVMDTMVDYIPNIRDIIVDCVVFSPPDLEQKLGLTGGHAEHGDMNLDQLFTNRPVPGWAHYRTPIQGLYLCGAGTHPGGTVTGAPGFNSAQAILSDMRARLV